MTSIEHSEFLAAGDPPILVRTSVTGVISNGELRTWSIMMNNYNVPNSKSNSTRQDETLLHVKVI